MVLIMAFRHWGPTVGYLGCAGIQTSHFWQRDWWRPVSDTNISLIFWERLKHQFSQLSVDRICIWQWNSEGTKGSERETDPLLCVVPIALEFGWNTSLLSIGQILVSTWSDGKLQRPYGISAIRWQSTHRATTLQLTIQIAVLQFCWHSMHSGYLVA